MSLLPKISRRLVAEILNVCVQEYIASYVCVCARLSYIILIGDVNKCEFIDNNTDTHSHSSLKTRTRMWWRYNAKKLMCCEIVPGGKLSYVWWDPRNYARQTDVSAFLHCSVLLANHMCVRLVLPWFLTSTMYGARNSFYRRLCITNTSLRLQYCSHNSLSSLFGSIEYIQIDYIETYVIIHITILSRLFRFATFYSVWLLITRKSRRSFKHLICRCDNIAHTNYLSYILIKTNSWETI